jgi:mycofactocin precursor
MSHNTFGVDEQAEPGEVPEHGELAGDDTVADVLVEEVSIDGMCGVY